MVCESRLRWLPPLTIQSFIFSANHCVYKQEQPSCSLDIKFLYKGCSGKQRHLTSISYQGWQGIAFMEVRRRGRLDGSNQTDMASVWKVDHSETEIFLESIYLLHTCIYVQPYSVNKERNSMYVSTMTAFSSTQWLIYNIINSDLFNVEWLAVVEPWFTWRLWPEGDVRLPGKSCLWLGLGQKHQDYLPGYCFLCFRYE